MPTEVQDIQSIANKVNKMSYGETRLRIKALEREYENQDLSFQELIELQYLTLKVIPR